MKICTDCGKLFDEVADHRAFMEYAYGEDTNEDRFVEYDTEPFGVPLCLECSIGTHYAIEHDMELDVD